MKKNVIVYGILAAVLVGTVAWAVTNKSKVVKKEEIKEKAPGVIRLVSAVDLEDVMVLSDIAESQGFYKKNNVVVEKVSTDKKDFTNMLMTGAADVSMGTYVGALTAYLSNAETRVVANAFIPYTRFGLSRFPKDQANMIKKVAVQSLTGDPVNTMNASLKKIGVDPASVEMVAAPSDDVRQEMLARGEIDFIIIVSEERLNAIDPARNFVVYDADEIQQGLKSLRPITTVDKVLNEKPEALKGFVTAVYQTLQFMDNNPEQVKQYLQEKYAFSSERAEAYYRRYQNARRDVPFVPSLEYVKNTAESIKQSQKIESDRNVEGFVFADYAVQASTK